MTRSKSPLWLSGAFLILTYAIFGWLSVTWQQPSRWILLATITFIANLIATYFDRAMDILLRGMFGASMWSLFCVLGLATFVVIILTKLPIFAYSSLILGTALFWSIDVHEFGRGRLFNFMLLAICQIFGLGLGFGSNNLWWRAVHYWPQVYYLN